MNWKSIKLKVENGNSVYLYLIFLLISFLLYGNTLPHKYNIDDAFLTNGNPQVKKGLGGLYEIFTSPYSDREDYVFGYRPIAKATFAIEYSIWGFNPLLSHLLNILLYSLSLFLLYILLRKIFGNQIKHRIWFIVLLFAAHPIHTEVVCSLKNREELLYLLFGFLSLWYFIRLYEYRKWYFFVLGIISLFLSLLSKQTGVVFIAIIPLSIIFISEFKFEFIQKTWLFKRNSYLLIVGLWWCSIIIHNILKELYPFTDYKWIDQILILACGLTMLWQMRKNQNLLTFKSLVSSLSLWIIILLMIMFTATYANFHFFISLIFVFAFIPFIKFSSIELLIELKKLKFSKHVLQLIGILAIIFTTTFIIFILTERITYEIAGTQDSKLYFWQNPLYFGSTETSLLANGFYSFLAYLKLLFFPYPLRFYYGYATIEMHTLLNPVVWIGFLLLVISFISGFQGYIRKRAWGFGLLIFIFALIPFLNFKWIVPGIIAERLSYLASFGFCIAFVDLLFYISEIKPQLLKQSTIRIILTLIIVVFSIMTFQRNKAWKNPQTLFETDLPHLTNSVKANDLYAAWSLRSAQELMAKNAPSNQIKAKLDQSLYHYKRTVQIYPPHLEGWNNVGIMYAKYYGNQTEALFYFNKAISYDSSYVNPYINIGSIFLINKSYQKALDTYLRVYKFQADNLEINNGIVQSYYGLNDTIQAVIWNNKVLNELKSPEMYYSNQGNYYLRNGDTTNAIIWLEKAFDVKKSDIDLCVFLGKYYSSQQNRIKASYFHDIATNIKKSKTGQK